jgi:hypothetical protein
MAPSIGMTPAWTSNLLDLYIETIEVFSKYNNVLAYNIGNEVVTALTEPHAAPFIKAAARDIKAYLCVHLVPVLSDITHASPYLRNSISSSALVGYAAIDGDPTWIVPLASYLACDPSGSNSGSTAIDLFGLND